MSCKEFLTSWWEFLRGEAMEQMRRKLRSAQRLVVKVGTSSLTYPTGKLNLAQMEKIVRELADLANQGRQVVLVTSGAVGAGMGRLGFKHKPKTLPEKQAAAAVGQGVLLNIYEKFFSEYNHVAAQVLLTREDFAHRERYLNARNTFNTLFSFGVIPIVNENDTIAVEEIRWGDNDTLAAMVAGLLGSDLLVILTDTDGFYTADPRKNPQAELISLIEEITPELQAQAGGVGTGLGTGGMATKLAAAGIAMNSGIPMVLAGAAVPAVLSRVIAGEEIGTLFLPANNGLHLRKRWIAFGSPAQGQIVVDDGAKTAIVNQGKSVLPAGVKAVAGSFEPGNVVKVLDTGGREVGRGIVNYSSSDLEKIKGCRTAQIAGVLGQKDYDEVIHRDNLSIYIVEEKRSDHDE